VGFKQRERKRRRKAATSSAQAKARESGSSAGKWWLTPLRSTACCARCATVIREGHDAVYRYKPREVRCLPCAERDPDSKGYRPSLAWERQRRARGRRR
jgi:hypothetical protein